MLTSTGHPSVLRTDSLPDSALPIDSEYYLRRFKYLRRVGIGQPRIQKSADFNGSPESSSKTVLQVIPDNVRPLFREWGLQALTPTMPEQRYFYDQSTQCGQVSNTENWVVVVPRVFVAGKADHYDEQLAPKQVAFKIEIGLRNESAAGFCGATIERRPQVGGLSELVVNGQPSTIPLLHPDVGRLTSGPLDFRVAFSDKKIYVAWRRTDCEEPWNEWQPQNEVERNADALTGPAWLSIKRIDNPVIDESVTIGAIEFATKCVAVVEQRVLEDQLLLQEVPTEDFAAILPLPTERI